MYADAVPIEVFVASCFQHPRIIGVISEWRVEPAKLHEIGTAYFKEMGIFFCQPNQKKILLNSLAYTLKYSKEVRTLIRKAENDETERRRTRHADV